MNDESVGCLKRIVVNEISVTVCTFFALQRSTGTSQGFTAGLRN